MNKTKKARFIIILFILASMSIGLILFFVRGIPFDVGDDLNHIIIAKMKSWKEVVIDSFDFSFEKEARFEAGEGREANTKGMFSRTGQVLILKVLYTFFGWQPFPYYFFKSLFFALLVVASYMGTYRLTQSNICSLCVAFFILLNAFTLYHAVWLSDLAIVVTSLIALTVYLLRRNISKTFFIALLFLGLAISRIKPSGYVIFFILFSFVILTTQRIKLTFNKRLFLIMGGFSVFIFIVAAFIFKEYNLALVRDFVIMNKTNGFEIERLPAIISLSANLPVSLFRTMGFFFIWAAVFSIAYAGKKCLEGKDIFFTLSFLWLFFNILFTGFARNEPRYLTDLIVPACFVFVYLFYKTALLLKGKARICFITWIVVGYIFAVSVNFNHIIFLQSKMLNHIYSFNKVSKIIYEDYYGHQPEGYYELARFTGKVLESPERLSHLIAFSQFNLWYDKDQIDPSLMEDVKERYGAAYLIFVGNNPPQEFKNSLRHLADINPNQEVPFTRFIAHFKKKRRPIVSIYKYI